MSKLFIACSILAPEIEQAMNELGLTNEIIYIKSALHVNLEKLKNAVIGELEKAKNSPEPPVLIIGTRCHPTMEQIAEQYGASIIRAGNCIEFLLGAEQMRKLDNECNTFYLTSGWLRQWRDIFTEGGHGWDAVDAKMNFGMYERILLLDTGFEQFSDEEIFEFFEYTGVPIETYPVTLDNIKETLLAVINN